MSFARAAAVTLVAAVPVLAAAQATYPTRPVRMIVPYPPGGGTDTAARIVGQKLSEAFGRPFVVENRPGANGNTGTDAIAKAAADGYTLGLATPGPVTIGKAIYPSLPYDPERDFVAIALLNASPNVLAVHPSVPARSVKELVALARAKPLRAGVSTIASVQHLLAEMFNGAAGVKIEVIAYKGGAQAATDVAGGQIESLWSVLPVVLPLLQSGRLRPLGVASPSRSTLLPAVPTMAEAGWPAVVATAWNGVVAPTGTPRPIVDQLNAAIGKALAAVDVRERFAAIGMEPLPGTAESFAGFLKEETARWARVVRAANIKIE